MIASRATSAQGVDRATRSGALSVAIPRDRASRRWFRTSSRNLPLISCLGHPAREGLTIARTLREVASAIESVCDARPIEQPPQHPRGSARAKSQP
jgi:hypothetical protein